MELRQRAVVTGVSLNNSRVSNNNVEISFSSGAKSTPDTDKSTIIPPEVLAQCFLRVARLDDNIFERINRYEVALWRQTAHVTVALHAMQNNSSARSRSLSK